MSGMWKRSHGRTSEAPPDERAATDMFDLPPLRHISTLRAPADQGRIFIRQELPRSRHRSIAMFPRPAIAIRAAAWRRGCGKNAGFPRYSGSRIWIAGYVPSIVTYLRWVFGP